MIYRQTVFFFLLLNLLPALLCFNNKLYAVETKMQGVMESLYDLNFSKADSLISEIEIMSNKHYLAHIARANYYWWQIITNAPNESFQVYYFNELESAEKILTKKSTKEPDHFETFYNIYVYASMARLDLLNENYLHGLRNLNRSVRFINASIGYEHSFTPFLLTSGLYNYLVDHGNSMYPMFRLYTMFLPQASRHNGIRQLQAAAKLDDLIIRTESHYFLMKIFQEIEIDFQNALIHARWLTENHPGNLVFLYHHYEISKHLELDEAQIVFQRIMDQIEYNADLSEGQKNHFLQLIKPY